MDREINGLYEFATYGLDPSKRLLTDHGKVIAIAPKTFDLLLIFLQSEGRLLGKQEIITRLWPDTFVEEANLTFQIATLRRALGHDAAQWIETVPKHGYRLTIPVRRATAPTAVTAVPAAEETHSVVGAHEPIGRRVSSWKWYGGVGFLILLSGALAVYWNAWRPSASEGGVGSSRVAVLPFENLSSEPDSEYFSRGLTEEVIHALATNGFQMVSRTSSFALDIKGRDLADIGAKLKADVIVEGSVRRAADRVRITVRLLQVSNDRQFWSEDYDRKLTDIITVQDEIARSIAEALGGRLAPRAKQPSHAFTSHALTTNVVAHDAYLKGRYFWSKRTPDSLEKSIAYFDQAIREDPNFALAYAGLADSYAVLAFDGIMRPARAFSAARSAAARALSLDSTLAQAHASLAFVESSYDWNPAAETEYLEAIRLDPGYATSHDWYSIWLISRGLIAEAIRESERAQELDPLSLIVRLHAAWPYYYSRRYPEAIDRFRKALELEPGFGARSGLCVAYVGSGLLAEALAECEKAATLNPGPVALAALAQALAVAGRRNEAMEVIERLEQEAKNRYVSYRLAIAYAGVGERDRAFLALESAVVEREPSMIYLNAEPRFDTLRGDPRYSALVRKILPLSK